MHEITCPHCKKAFKVDEAGYADILKQVRDSDFERQIHERLELAEKEKLNAIELAETKVGRTKDAEIQDLQAKLDASEAAQKIALTEALIAVEKERDALANELEKAKQASQAASTLAEAKLGANEVAQKLAITEALNEVEKEREELKSSLKQVELEKQLSEKRSEERRVGKECRYRRSPYQLKKKTKVTRIKKR